MCLIEYSFFFFIFSYYFIYYKTIIQHNYWKITAYFLDISNDLLWRSKCITLTHIIHPWQMMKAFIALHQDINERTFFKIYAIHSLVYILVSPHRITLRRTRHIACNNFFRSKICPFVLYQCSTFSFRIIQKVTLVVLKNS